MVDEPELHLHPTWQRHLLSLMRVLAHENGNQFILGTHSPVFVDPRVLRSVSRIHKPLGATSVAQIADAALPTMRTLVQIITADNNEKLFFADRIILVEGITDKAVFQALLDASKAERDQGAAIELVSVGGKDNFAHYMQVVQLLKIPYCVIADRDYALNLPGGGELKPLFTSSTSKLNKLLSKKKGSPEKTTLLRALDAAIASRDWEELVRVRKALESSTLQLRTDVSEVESSQLRTALCEKRAEGIYLLLRGEIEDYLPPGCKGKDAKGKDALFGLLGRADWKHSFEPHKLRELEEIARCASGAYPAQDVVGRALSREAFTP